MPRPAAGPTLALSAACLLGALLGGAPASAQTIAGRVVDADGGAGVSGAFVVLADSAGRRRGAVLSDGEGRFLLTAPAPGRYTVRAERIGMTTRTVPAFTLAAGERRSFAISLAADAVPLAAIEVSAKRRRCELRPGAGEATARVWEEVRKSLRISSWARSAFVLHYRIRREERYLDLPSRTVRADTVKEMVGSGARPVETLRTPEQVAREGYVTTGPADSVSYSGPDDDILASEEFLETHCLQLIPPADSGARRLGVEFRPARRDGPKDIRGTAWLDVDTRELRSIDFRYTGLPQAYDLEAGGSVQYHRLPSGLWIVDGFRLAFPLMHKTLRARPVMQSGAGGGIEEYYQPYGLHETLSQVLDLWEPGSARPALREDSAGLGAVAGAVWDSIRRRPLAGARVYLSGTSRSVLTDAAGRFRIAGVTPGRYAVAFDHPVMDSLPVRPAPVDDVVSAGAEAQVALAIPSAATVAARACPYAQEAGAGPVLFGTVADFAPGVIVTAAWSTVSREGGRLSMRRDGMQVTPDGVGRFVVCGAPADQEILLRTLRQTYSGTTLRGAEVRVTAARGTLQHVQLAAPKS